MPGQDPRIIRQAYELIMRAMSRAGGGMRAGEMTTPQLKAAKPYIHNSTVTGYPSVRSMDSPPVLDPSSGGGIRPPINLNDLAKGVGDSPVMSESVMRQMPPKAIESANRYYERLNPDTSAVMDKIMKLYLGTPE